MPDWRVALDAGSIFLPDIGWHLDAHRRVARSFVSHAHGDHLGGHREVLCSPATAAFMRARLPGRRDWTTPAWGQPWDDPEGRARFTLHPAGHILGSAQALVEGAWGRLLYTGDFRLQAGPTCEPCATPTADVLVMETTFGRPQFVFPPAEEVWRGLSGFCRRSLDQGVVPVLFAYSLGKAQELLAGLAHLGVPFMLSEPALQLAALYEELGQPLPPRRGIDPTAAAGHIVIAPHESSGGPLRRALGPHRCALASGWAMESGAVYRYGCDAAFPLSDHADYPGLLEFVRRVSPRLVLTTHGYAADFARTLRARGVEAWPLGEDRQLELSL